MKSPSVWALRPFRGALVEGLDQQTALIYAPIQPLLGQVEQRLNRLSRSDRPYLGPLLEYVLAKGNKQLMLCERGIRTFENYTRNTLDITAIPVIKRLSHLPIISDPSHGTGKWHLVIPAALASVAAGAHGLIVEVHPNPDKALSDGAQSLNFENFRKLAALVTAVKKATEEVPNAL